MTVQEKMKQGRLYIDAADPELMKTMVKAKELIYDFNQTRPSELEKRTQLIHEIFAEVGKDPFIEPPMHMAYGNRVHIGDRFYANFNMVIVDDIDVYIGNDVMFAPNVTITVTGHPVAPELRANGRQFSFPVHIEDNVWIGANVVILPGVTIGKGSVIGAGSVVTKDIPPNVVAVGSPCRVLRPIGDRDREYYFKDRKIEPVDLE
ncbi:MAG: maltose acetyltransferase domain-containing protein [Massiliimalia sp.]|jgi:galactoside O-acetyltransferase